MSESQVPAPFVLPPGTFQIDRDGLWRHEGQEVTHPGVLRNLFANLRVDADGHYLQVGPARIPVDVEDAPFVAVRVEAPRESADGPLSLRIYLSDGDEETLVPDSVWLHADGVPYCRVKSGRFTARFALPAWLQLAHFVEEGPGGEAILALAGVRVPLSRRG